MNIGPLWSNDLKVGFKVLINTLTCSFSYIDCLNRSSGKAGQCWKNGVRNIPFPLNAAQSQPLNPIMSFYVKMLVVVKQFAPRTLVCRLFSQIDPQPGVPKGAVEILRKVEVLSKIWVDFFDLSKQLFVHLFSLFSMFVKT